MLADRSRRRRPPAGRRCLRATPDGLTESITSHFWRGAIGDSLAVAMSKLPKMSELGRGVEGLSVGNRDRMRDQVMPALR